MKFLKRRKKGYRFADDLVASDTIISLVSGGLGLAIIIAVLIMAITTQGKTPEAAGTMIIISALLAINGLFFAITSYKQEAGNTNTKRMSVILALGDLLMLFVMWLL